MTEPFIHPFEKAGLGKAPFKLLYCVSLPSTSLAEQNPEAYNRAMREAVQSGAQGTCCFCGMGIMHNYIVADVNDKRFAVGSECVAKTGQKELIKQVRSIESKRAKEQRLAREAAKYEAWLGEDCGNGETNKARMEREGSERQAKRDAARAEAKARDEAREAAKAADIANSKFVGEVGQRLDLELTYVFWTSFPGQFGTFFIQSFRTKDGATVVYKGAAPIGYKERSLEKGETIKVKATVKSQGEYNGVKQTVIARAKVTELEVA